MNGKITVLCAFVMFAGLYICSCSPTDWEPTVSCEELETVFFDGMAAGEIEKVHEDAVQVYKSLEGEWGGQFHCTNMDGIEQATVTMTGVSEQYVEFYQGVAGSNCAALGKAVFFAELSGSGDADLDGVSFEMTADLYAKEETSYDASSVFVLEAQSDSGNSSVAGFDSFRLKIRVDYNAEITAAKYATTSEVAGSGGTVSISQGDYCALDQMEKIQ